MFKLHAKFRFDLSYITREEAQTSSWDHPMLDHMGLLGEAFRITKVFCLGCACFPNGRNWT